MLYCVPYIEFIHISVSSATYVHNKVFVLINGVRTIPIYIFTSSTYYVCFHCACQ